MKDELAERLLAQVMSWSPQEVAENRPYLQDMARYKFDEYQQFSPGMRFVESLALWLRQFGTLQERKSAYDFVTGRLIYFSSPEIAHIVSIAYPDYIRPILLERAAKDLGLSPIKVGAIAESPSFRALQRQTLFLALSDGARTDIFRRVNPELSHEQIWHAYDMSETKAKEMANELRTDLAQILGRQVEEKEARYRIVCLLDDFSASGMSYLRRNQLEKERSSKVWTLLARLVRRKIGKNEYKGKIAKVLNHIRSPDGPLCSLISKDDIFVCVVIYIASEQAISHLAPLGAEIFGNEDTYEIQVVQKLPGKVKLRAETDREFLKLVDADSYYDPRVENRHTRVGNEDGTVRRGFADCALPVVLTHNTPNNSVFLLWGSPDQRVRGLFPRVSRHQGDSDGGS